MKGRPARFVLDSFALLAHLEAEAGGRRVKAILAQAEKERAEEAVLLTGDPEFHEVKSLVRIEWLPQV